MKHISHSIDKFMEVMDILYGKKRMSKSREIDYRVTIDVSFIVDDENQAVELIKKDVQSSFEGHTKLQITKIEKKGERDGNGCLWEKPKAK